MSRPPLIATLVSCLLLASTPSLVAAQNETKAVEDSSVRPVLRALPIKASSIELDGRLTESVWRMAEAGSGFSQREPSDGSPASERTEVRVLRTESAIYVGVRAFDSEPDQIRSQLVRRDASVQSDQITIYFDSYYDRRTCFSFAVTPRGSIRDAYASDDSQWGDASWDPVWQVKTAIDSAGWTAEFRIPLTQLRFDKQGKTWGFQVHRRIERKAEEVWWAPYSKEGSGFASRFGELQGMDDLPSPMRLEIRPYIVTSNRRRPEAPGTRYAPTSLTRFDAGLDLKYGITSDFTLDLTVNPDFGQVEADPAVVNLSAFESYFPEKRPFFVEGGALFAQWVPGGQLFYSRRIGRPPQGYASPPSGGTVEIPDASTIVSAVKVTGKSADGLGLGIMSAVTTAESATLRDSTNSVTGRERVAPLAHHLAARAEQDFKSGSQTVGATFTALNRRLRDEFESLRSAAYVGELDGRHRWKGNTYSIEWQIAVSHLRGSQDAILSSQRSSARYFQRPDAEHVEEDTSRTSLSGYSARLHFGKEAGAWRYYAGYQRVSPEFDFNELGFQRRADFQGTYYGVSYQQVKPFWMFRTVRLALDGSQRWTTGNERIGTWFRPVHIYAAFKNNWTLSLNPVAFEWARVSVHMLRGGPSLKQNAWHNSWMYLQTDRRKPVSGSLWTGVGGIIGTDEWSVNLSPSVNIRPNSTLSATVGVDYSWTRDPEQWVTRQIVDDSTRYVFGIIEQKTLNVSTRVDWTLSPTLSVQLYAQPFVSAARYRDFKEVIAPQADRFDDRFHVYGDALRCADGACEVDEDGDGTAELSFGQPDFNFKSLRSTVVLRWEYRPGSVLFLAWQHGRSDYVQNGSFGGLRDLGNLFSLDSDNTLLVKFNYWVGL